MQFAGMSVRHYFSLNQLDAACELALVSEELEREFSNVSVAEKTTARKRVQACSIGALISSVAFLEATINEVFADCHDGSSPHGETYPNAKLLAELWAENVPKTASYSVLEKYQIALALADRPKMPRNEDPFQSADDLIFARNRLIHFEPETIHSTTPPEKPKLQKIHARLRGKFEPNSLAQPNSFFFPDKALGA